MPKADTSEYELGKFNLALLCACKCSFLFIRCFHNLFALELESI